MPENKQRIITKDQSNRVANQNDLSIYEGIGTEKKRVRPFKRRHNHSNNHMIEIIK